MASTPKTLFTALKIVNVNVNGLCSKVNFLSQLLNDQGVKLACITETHLVPSISNSFIDIPH